MLYDIPGRTQPTKVILYHEGREKVFQLPYEPKDEIEERMLRDFPLVSVVPPAPARPVPTPEPEKEEVKPRPSKKEV